MDSSSQFELLLHCLRHRIDGRIVADRDLQRCVQHIDWLNFLVQAGRHRVLPQVCSAIDGGHFGVVPAFVVDRLKRRQRRILIRNIQLATELRSIVAACRKAGMPVLPFKGPTLAVELYGGLQGRQFNDLDLMIRPADLRVALTTLQGLGYHVESTPIQRFSDSRLRQLTGRFNEHTLLRADHQGVIKVDLHWQYSDDRTLFATPHEELFGAESYCMIGAQKIRTVPFEQNVVYLAYHACKHQCMRLSWLCDFAVAWHTIAKDDWNHVLMTLQPQTRRMVICALLMLEQLSLTDSLDGVVHQIVRWRRKLRGVTTTIHQVVRAEQAVPLHGAMKNGVWRSRLSGRLRPLFNCLLKSILPMQADLSETGWARPHLSRWQYISRLAASRISDTFGTPNRTGAVCDQSGRMKSVTAQARLTGVRQCTSPLR